MEANTDTGTAPMAIYDGIGINLFPIISRNRRLPNRDQVNVIEHHYSAKIHFKEISISYILII